MRSSAVLPNKYDKILNFLEVAFKNIKNGALVFIRYKAPIIPRD